MNIIGFLPLILLDFIGYNQYKETFKVLDMQHKEDVYRIQNDLVEPDEMDRILDTKMKRCLCMAPITRTEMYLSYMTKEDREYIFDMYVVNQSANITKRTCDIFMSIDLLGSSHDQERKDRVS